MRLPLLSLALLGRRPLEAGITQRPSLAHPVLRGSEPSKPSRNREAEAATRSWVNNGRIRVFTPRSDDAHSSSVVSIETLLKVYPLPSVSQMGSGCYKSNCRARVVRHRR